MDVALKIWRFDPETGERALREYEVDAPEWACLLDVLDLIKDKHDGTLAYRKSCRMMICGSCGMRMDGRAVLACKERMKPIADAGHVPVISAMGNMPVLKDLVVDMAPFWEKIRADQAVARPRLRRGRREGADRLPAGDERDPQGSALHHVRLLRLGVQLDGVRPGVPRARGAREGLPLRRRRARPGRRRAAEELNEEHGIWDCTRCYFCNERCPKGVDPRDAIAKLGAESIKQGIDHDMGAKHAKWFVRSAETTGWLRETELVPKTQGVIEAIKQTRFALKLARRGKVPFRSRRTSRRTSRRPGAARPGQGAGPRRRARDRPGRAARWPDRVPAGVGGRRRRP